MIPEEGLNGKLENKLSVTENNPGDVAVILELANEPVIGTCPAVQY